MEQEIVVLEAPNDARPEQTTVDEKYSLLLQSLRLDTVESIKSLDEEEADLTFNSNILSLMVQELLNYCIPIWDRLDETDPPVHGYSIRTPIKRHISGYVGTTQVGKSSGYADIIGLKSRKVPDLPWIITGN